MKTRDETLPCRDCGVAVGAEHLEGCDVARCLATGGQRLSCELGFASALAEALGGPVEGMHAHDCGRQIWSGLWPGVAECREYGWYARFDPPPPGEQYGAWRVTTADDPDGSEDLNRLHIGCEWDAEQQRFVKRADTFGYLCVSCEADLRPPGLIPRYPVQAGAACPDCGALQVRSRPDAPKLLPC